MVSGSYHLKWNYNKFLNSKLKMEDDYLYGDEEELDEGFYQPAEDEDDESEDSSEVEEEAARGTKKAESAKYEDLLTKDEVWLMSAYDDIVAAGRNNKENAIEDAATIVVQANPKHTAAATIGYIVKDLFHKQGHSRMQNSIYTPDTPLRGEDVDEEFNLSDDSSFNRFFAEEARNQIAKFIKYLANRDLSKDSVVSRRRKLRHIPAFIIFLFSSGLYDLIINCPTMPVVYAKQINNALQKIMGAKYDVVEKLAQEYEKRGRDKVADMVRKKQIAWFTKEPAEIRTTSEYADLDLTYDDVVVYREFRSRFTNISKSITQDVISDLIEVVIDEEAGIYEKLKDKTRAEAIADVKQVYKNWSKDNAAEELANKVIWTDI